MFLTLTLPLMAPFANAQKPLVPAALQQQEVPRLSAAELEDIAERLTRLSELGALLQENKVKAADFMVPYMELQNLLLQKLSALGVKARLADALDYGGVPMIPMYNDSPREVKLRYVQESFLPDVAEAMLAPGIEIEPVKNGTYLNNLAFQLSRRFGSKLILEFARINNVGAAAYSKKDNYVSLPPAILSNAIELQTYHELQHLIQARTPHKKPQIFDIDVTGKEALKGLADSPYAVGYSVDELRAYAFGVHQELSLSEKMSTDRVPVLLLANDKWEVLNSALHGKHVIELTQRPEDKIAIASQVADFNALFLESLKFVKPLAKAKWSEDLEMRVFLKETLIVISPKSGLKMSISQFGGLKGAPKVSLSHGDNILTFKLSKEDTPLLAQILQGNLKNPETHALALKLWQKGVDEAKPLLADLNTFIEQMIPLNEQLQQALKAKDLPTATKTIKNMIGVIKTY